MEELLTIAVIAVPILFVAGHLTGVIRVGQAPKGHRDEEARERDRERLEAIRIKEREAAEERARYESLSPEGKLLYDMQEKQATTGRYAKGIFWFLMAGAIATVLFFIVALSA